MHSGEGCRERLAVAPKLFPAQNGSHQASLDLDNVRHCASPSSFRTVLAIGRHYGSQLRPFINTKPCATLPTKQLFREHFENYALTAGLETSLDFNAKMACHVSSKAFPSKAKPGGLTSVFPICTGLNPFANLLGLTLDCP